MKIITTLLVLLCVEGCGPADKPGGEGPDARPTVTGISASLQGRVWAPGLAPSGIIPAGHEIPVARATVWLTDTRPPAIPLATHCEQCLALPSNAVESGSDGSFIIDVPSGDYWLVIQKGQFRRETRVAVQPGANVATTEQTTLPSRHNPAQGESIPRIALATGAFDYMETIFGKMGIGSSGPNGEFVSPEGAFDIYGNGGLDYGTSVGTLRDLVTNLSRMLSYHIIFIPCSSDIHAAALREPAVLNNLREFVKAGGKLYVTDWSGEWMDNVFPAQVELGPQLLPVDKIDTPPSAYDRQSNTWNTSQFGNADGDAYDSTSAEAIEPDLRNWLTGQAGPYANSNGAGPFDPMNFAAMGSWNWIKSLSPVVVGVDENGQTVTDTPRAWVKGDRDALLGGSTEKTPLTVTFEPAGCGRVLYSTYHTSELNHLGLHPQERILLFLLLEIGVCRQGPIVIE